MNALGNKVKLYLTPRVPMRRRTTEETNVLCRALFYTIQTIYSSTLFPITLIIIFFSTERSHGDIDMSVKLRGFQCQCGLEETSKTTSQELVLTQASTTIQALNVTTFIVAVSTLFAKLLGKCSGRFI